MAVGEQPHCEQIGLFRVDPLHLALDVTPNQHGPHEELNLSMPIAGFVNHSGHFMGVVTDDP